MFNYKIRIKEILKKKKMIYFIYKKMENITRILTYLLILMIKKLNY